MHVLSRAFYLSWEKRELPSTLHPRDGGEGPRGHELYRSTYRIAHGQTEERSDNSGPDFFSHCASGSGAALSRAHPCSPTYLYLALLRIAWKR